MAAPRFVPGNTVEVVGTFTDNAGPATPSEASLTVRFPDGTRQTFVLGDDSEMTQVGLGVYQVNVLADQVGTYWYRWEGTLTTKTADEKYFVVIPSAVLIEA